MKERKRLKAPLRVVAVMACATALALGLLTWAITSPRSDEGGSTDVLVVLGPSTEPRLQLARQILADGGAKVLIVSAHPSDTLWKVPAPCSGGTPFPTYCFDPRPATTQGEARAVSALMKQHGWVSARALTWTPHVERARMILGRCLPGRVAIQRVDQPFDFLSQLAYQGGGYVKALAHPGC